MPPTGTNLREFHGELNKSLVFASTRSLIGGLPALGELSTALGEISAKASINGHSGDLETEADLVGIKQVVKAGYDPREATKLLQHLVAEMEEEREGTVFLRDTPAPQGTDRKL